MQFTRCTFELAKFSGLDLSEFRFDGSAFVEADLAHCNLTEASFLDCNLSDVRWEDAHFSDTDLRGANLSGLDPRRIDLRGAVITPGQARQLAEALGLTVIDELDG